MYEKPKVLVETGNPAGESAGDFALQVRMVFGEGLDDTRPEAGHTAVSDGPTQPVADAIRAARLAQDRADIIARSYKGMDHCA